MAKEVFTEEKALRTIESGTFEERMLLFCNYYAFKSYDKQPPISDAQAQKLREAICKDGEEGIEERLLRWEILINLAERYAKNIRPNELAYRASVYSTKALLEQYQALRAVEGLADALLEQGVTAEEAEAIVAKRTGFSKGKSPYTIRITINGTAAALLMDNKTARDIEIEIKAEAKKLREYLRAYKAATEAFFSYFKRIDMEPYMIGAARFWNQFNKMCFAPFDADINSAYLDGTEPHKESAFPDLITYYDSIKLSERGRATQERVLNNSVEILWKQKRIR